MIIKIFNQNIVVMITFETINNLRFVLFFKTNNNYYNNKNIYISLLFDLFRTDQYRVKKINYS